MLPPGNETTDRAAATALPVALVPLSGVSSCARHLGGCLLARAPDLFVSDEAGACMKPDLGVLVGVLLPLDPVLIVSIGMPWEFMEINKFLREITTGCCSGGP